MSITQCQMLLLSSVRVYIKQNKRDNLAKVRLHAIINGRPGRTDIRYFEYTFTSFKSWQRKWFEKEQRPNAG